MRIINSGPTLSLLDEPKIQDSVEGLQLDPTKETEPRLETPQQLKSTERVSQTHRTKARFEEGRLRAHLAQDLPSGQTTPDKPARSLLVGMSEHSVRSHFAKRLAQEAGQELSSDIPPLRKDKIRKRARLMGSLAHHLDQARAEGDADQVHAIEQRLTERFGEDAVPRVDEALRVANSEATRPRVFAPRIGVGDHDPHSERLVGALGELASESLVRDSLGEETLAKMDQAYAQMSPQDRARLDTELKVIEKDRSFVEGMGAGLNDTGVDLKEASQLAWDLMSDGDRRAAFGRDMGIIADALGNPELRPQVLELIGSELGDGIIQAFENFDEDPDYYTGYLAAPLVAGGGVLKASRLAAVAGRLESIKEGALEVGQGVARAGLLTMRTQIDSTHALTRWYGTTFVEKLRAREASAWAYAGVNVLEGVNATMALADGSPLGAATSVGIVLASKVPYLAWEYRKGIVGSLAVPEGRYLIASVAGGMARQSRDYIMRGDENWASAYAEGTLHRALQNLQKVAVQ